MNQPIGINSFGLNALFHQDFEGTCAELKSIGFSSIEPMIVFPKAMNHEPDMMLKRLAMAGKDGAFWTESLAKERIAQLRASGFSVQGAHLGLINLVPGGLEALLPFAAEFASENRLSYMVHSPQKKRLKEIEADIQAFKKGLPLLKEQGTELLFHCHYHEFADDQSDTPFAYLLRQVPELRLELDVGWVQYSGLNVLRLMEEYRDRIAIIHFKDILPQAPEMDHDQICTAIGEGCLPLKEIIAMSNDLSLSYTGYVIDQDTSNGDMMDDLIRGYRNIRTLAK